MKKLGVLIFGPLLRRIGTVAATALIARDIPAEQVAPLMQALGVVLALTFDIIVSYQTRAK